MSWAAAKAAWREEMVEPGETREVVRVSFTSEALVITGTATDWAWTVIVATQAHRQKMRCRRLTGGISAQLANSEINPT